MQYHNLDFVVAFHPKRYGYKAAPGKQEHNNLPQTSKLEGGRIETYILHTFTPLNNSHVFVWTSIKISTGYTHQERN